MTRLLRLSVLPNLPVRPRLPRLAAVLMMSMIAMGTRVCPCAIEMIPVSLCTSLGSARRCLVALSSMSLEFRPLVSLTMLQYMSVGLVLCLCAMILMLE